MGALFVDVTEFVTNPIRTGIQRVIRELLGRWPGSVPRQVVWFDDRVGALATVPDELLTYLIDSASDPFLDGDQVRVKSLNVLASEAPRTVTVRRGDRVLIPELFASRARALFYKGLHDQNASVRAIVYDILAWTQPDALNVTTVGPFNDYIEVLRLADARCHISQWACEEFTGRILRKDSAADSVISLGADALGRRPAGLPVLPQLILPGALDGRKGQDRILDAYMTLPEASRLPLIVAGRIPANPRPTMQRLLSTDCQTVSIIDDPGDAQLAALIASSQGCLFASQFEGFGLPALESLYLGTPVVVDAHLPALSGFPSHGQIRLEVQTPEEIAEALMTISDRRSAEQLRQAAATLTLPTWDDYAGQVAAWASQ